MKIPAIRATPVPIPRGAPCLRSCGAPYGFTKTVVAVETDSGATGIAEAASHAAAKVTDACAPRLRGQHPLQVAAPERRALPRMRDRTAIPLSGHDTAPAKALARLEPDAIVADAACPGGFAAARRFVSSCRGARGGGLPVLCAGLRPRDGSLPSPLRGTPAHPRAEPGPVAPASLRRDRRGPLRAEGQHDRASRRLRPRRHARPGPPAHCRHPAAREGGCRADVTTRPALASCAGCRRSEAAGPEETAPGLARDGLSQRSAIGT